MSHLSDDLRFALRYLRRRPAFTVTVLLTLALAIGATTAIFSLVYGVVLRPLDLPRPDRLVFLSEDQSRRGGAEQDVTSVAMVHEWREHSRSFSGVVGSINNDEARVAISTAEGAQGVLVNQVSPGYFAVLGVPPALGREILPAEEITGHDGVVLLSYALWQRAFGGSPAVLGKQLRINGKSHTIVGVMPPSLRDPLVPRAELWIPLAVDSIGDDRGNNYVRAVARLKDGVTLDQARADVAQVMRGVVAQYPDAYHDVGAGATPLLETLVGNVKKPGMALFAAVLLVLLIACVNLANLLLARAAERDREIAVRTAVGANRRRTIVQLVTESLVLAGGGGLLGLAVGAALLRVLVRLAPAGMPRLDDVALHPAVLLFALGATLVVGLLFGLVPALRAARAEPASTLRQGSRSLVRGASGGLRRGLIVAEVGISLALLVGAGLLVRTLMSLSAVDPGFAPHHLLMAQVALPEARYADEAAVARGVHALEERMRALPGVQSVGSTTSLPLTNYFSDTSLHVEGSDSEEGTGPVQFAAVTPTFFETFGQRLLAGRNLAAGDDGGGERVMVVNEVFARRFLHGDAVGKRVRLGRKLDNPWWTIVGVVSAVHHGALSTAPEPQFYLPENRVGLRAVQIVMRSGADPRSVAPAVRSAVAQVDPELPVMVLRRGDELVTGQLAMPRFLGALLGSFALVALALALVGIYGVMSFLVSQRHREMGIRLALGALPRSVLSMVMREAAGLTIIGLVVGGAVAIGLARGLASQLFGVKPADPATLAGAAVLVSAAALLATMLPAARAARVQPSTTLRED